MSPDERWQNGERKNRAFSGEQGVTRDGNHNAHRVHFRLGCEMVGVRIEPASEQNNRGEYHCTYDDAPSDVPRDVDLRLREKDAAENDACQTYAEEGSRLRDEAEGGRIRKPPRESHHAPRDH